MYGPDFPCVCCYSRKFQDQAKVLDEDLMTSIQQKAPRVLEKFVFQDGPDKYPEDCLIDIGEGKQAWLCGTCKTSYLVKDKMPPTCWKNKMEVKPSLQDNKETALEELESALISHTIQFQKIYPMRGSRWSCLDGKVINVPISSEKIMETVSSFPRTPSNAGLVGVEIKRKKKYTGSYIKPRIINPAKLFLWLRELRRLKNPHYQYVVVLTEEEYEAVCAERDFDGHQEIFGGDDVQEDLEEMPEDMKEVEDEVFQEYLGLPDEVYYDDEEMADATTDDFMETVEEEDVKDEDDCSEVPEDNWGPEMSDSEDGDEDELCGSDEEGNN